jgi:hypothetical protein
MKKYNVTLSYKELSAILCGLRLLQRDLCDFGTEFVQENSAHFIDVKCPTMKQIDALCEKLNS